MLQFLLIYQVVQTGNIFLCKVDEFIQNRNDVLLCIVKKDDLRGSELVFSVFLKASCSSRITVSFDFRLHPIMW